MCAVRLLVPDASTLQQYLKALSANWTPDSDNDPDGARALRDRIEADPAAYLNSLRNPGANGPPVALEDGRLVPRLAHVRYWISDGSYCGDINLRWQREANELPPYCDGHVGYAVVPWKRRQGHATGALRALAQIAPNFGLKWLDIAMDAENVASIRVAEAAGAVLVEEYVAVERGGAPARRYRLTCSDVAGGDVGRHR
jgi:predicted acetyltransferase